MSVRFRLSRLLFSILIVFSTIKIDAATYDNGTLEIISKIIPRFVLMSSQKDKLNNNINICILREEIEKNSALLLREKIEKNNPNGINNYFIKYTETDFNNLEVCKNTHLSFIFNTNKKDIKETINRLNKYQILTMSYDEKYLKDGVGISLFIGRKVLPYLNIKAIYSNNIQIDNILLRVSKIYEEEE